MVRRSALLFLLVALVSIAGFVAPRPASACSCAQLDPAAGLAEYPAAFVGTLVNVDRGVAIGGIPVDGGADAVYRFEVEQWVKGDLGDIVDVHSAADGAACGIEVGVGNRAGVFLSDDGDKVSSSLCSTIDPDVLLAGIEPLTVGAPGPAVLLVSGSIGGYSYLLLNSRGEIVAGVNGPVNQPFEQPWQFAMCPGSRTLVEQWSRFLVVRNLSDLTVVRQIDLGEYADTTGFSGIKCIDADGSSILMTGEEWNGNQSVSRLFRIGDSLEPDIELPTGQTWLGRDFAVVQGYDSGEVSLVDLESGEEKTLHQETQGDHGFVAVSSVAISPDDSTVAISGVRYDDPETGGADTRVLLYTTAGELVGSSEFDGEAWWLYWLDDDRLMVNRSTNGFGNSASVFETPGMDVVVELDGWQGTNPVTIDGLVYATEGGSIVTTELGTGTINQLNVLPTQFIGPIAALPADFAPSPDVIGDDPEVNTPNTVPPLFSDAFGPGDVVDARVTARIVLGILVTGGVIVYLITRRRREGRSDARS